LEILLKTGAHSFLERLGIRTRDHERLEIRLRFDPGKSVFRSQNGDSSGRGISQSAIRTHDGNTHDRSRDRQARTGIEDVGVDFIFVFKVVLVAMNVIKAIGF